MSAGRRGRGAAGAVDGNDGSLEHRRVKGISPLQRLSCRAAPLPRYYFHHVHSRNRSRRLPGRMRRLWPPQSGLLPQPVRAGPVGDAARGPGMDVFTRGAPGRRCGRPSSTTGRLRSRATCSASSRRSPITAAPASPCGRPRGGSATTRSLPRAEFVFVCVDREGRPIPVAAGIQRVHECATAMLGDAQRIMVNGVNLAVEERGEGPAVLFVHGYPLDRSIWSEQLGALEGFRRIAPDLRGMGQSDAPDLGYGMGIYAADLAALLDVLGVDEVVLCGLSMGGYVAFEFLRQWRPRVRAPDPHGHARRRRFYRRAPRARRGRRHCARGRRRGRRRRDVAEVLAAGSEARAPELVEQVRRIMAATPVAGIDRRAGRNAGSARQHRPFADARRSTHTGRRRRGRRPDPARRRPARWPLASLAHAWWLSPAPVTSRRSSVQPRPPRSSGNSSAWSGETFCGPSAFWFQRADTHPCVPVDCPSTQGSGVAARQFDPGATLLVCGTAGTPMVE